FLSLLGGWPGALLGQYHLNLSPRSLLFQLVMLCIVLGHIVWLIWTLTPKGITQLHALISTISSLLLK
ncbi:MAG: DUF1294 domain-containing protein, partial [Vibrionaceae bacterium]